MNRPLVTTEDLRRVTLTPRARWRLFGLTRRDLDKAKRELTAAIGTRP